MQIRSVSIVNNNMQRLASVFIFWSFVALASWYVLLVGNMVMNIVERRSFEKEALTLSNEVRDLELVYLSMTDDINLDLSHSLGFKEVNTKFATRKALGSISIAKNEI